jgi:hypothetical protein
MIPKPTQNLTAGTAEELEDVWLSGHTQDFIAWLAYQICQTFNRLAYNGGALLLIILQLKNWERLGLMTFYPMHGSRNVHFYTESSDSCILLNEGNVGRRASLEIICSLIFPLFL